MPSIQSLQIASAVGNQPALNRTDDQEVILDLLQRIAPDDGGPANPLPGPTAGGRADFRLVNAIFDFQGVMVSRGLLPTQHRDARVDPNGGTLRLMNRFADSAPSGGGGLLIPVDPPTPKPAPAPALKKGPGFLQSLFARMAPRPTNLSIAGTATVSLSAATFGIAGGQMSVSNSLIPGSLTPLNMAGGGLSLGPIPFGVEIAPSDFPSLGSQISAGPRTTTTTLAVEDLLGVCLLIAASASPPVGVGGNGTAILFNIGSNRTLATLAFDVLNSLNSNVAIGFVIDSFNTCKAFGSTVGVFAGISLGVSLIEVALVKAVPGIRPDPVLGTG